MIKVKLYSKIFSIFLIVSILFTACDVPDISEFTTQSAEMTRGIRKGVNDSIILIKTAADRDDLYSANTRQKLKVESKKYQKALKPTLDALDGLDGYLGALNALSQANKKSEENSKALVNSVSSLVTSVSGFTFASEVINVASGLLTLEEQFRTTRSFKKRVNIASEIIEGRYIEKTQNYTVNGETKQRTYLKKTCNENAGDQIVSLSKNVQEIIDPILIPLADKQKQLLKSLPAASQKKKLQEWKRVNDEELAILESLSPKSKREKLNEWGRISDYDYSVITATELTINAFGCGVIDFLKFNIIDLKEINQAVSQSIIDNIKNKDATVLKLDNKIDIRRMDIRNILDSNQDVINLITRINEYMAISAGNELILNRKVRLKINIDDVFTRDSVTKAEILKSIRDCGRDCGKMIEILQISCDKSCEDRVREIFRNGISPSEFEYSNAKIIQILNIRNSELDDEDKKLKSRIDLLKPDYDAVNADLSATKTKKDQLDLLFSTSLSALDAWVETHANLRVAVNTKQPLSVAKLISKVREIWTIADPS